MVHMPGERFEYPEVPSAERKKKTKLKELAARLRREGRHRPYLILNADGTLYDSFDDVSLAKRYLDSVKLPVGTAVVRLSDGAEIAYTHPTKY